MRARTLKLLSLLLALAVTLPLRGDAGIPVPAASQAACCNASDVPPPPPQEKLVSDEAFFNLPSGVPNIMVLLDTSGSMFGFPQDITYPAWSADSSNRGSCSLNPLNAHTPLNTLGLPDTTLPPFDNGFNNGAGTFDTVDDPPWGLQRCEAKQARPAGNNQNDYCLFRADSFYKAMGAADSAGGWDSSTTRVYNANPCSAITANNGNPITDYAGAMVQANDLAQCTSCLANSGFYVMNPRYRSGGTAGSPIYSAAGNQVVFSGWFLNGYPPKYVAARKVVKDLIRLDATVRPTTDSVRFGLTVFNGGSSSGYATTLRATDGGTLVVPVGPNCDQSFPINRGAFNGARQTMINAINATKTATDWSDTLYVNFGGNTPLAETLFNVGQYFTNTGTGALYPSLFTNSWVRAGFAETAGGSVNATWTGAGNNQHSFCWACQQSSVVVVTDGAPNADSNLPKSPTPGANHSTFNSDFRRWSNPTIDCPTCGTDLSGSPANAMHKVAYFLSQTDLRPDLSNGARPQTLSTYTISFGISQATDPEPVALLQKTALLGNGIFANSSSAQELANALSAAVADVIERSTSFSSANANSLQTSRTTGVDSYLGRFRPNNSPMWEGHLFAAGIFDEFGQGCDETFSTADQKMVSCGSKPTQNPNMNGDEDPSTGKAICASSFLTDQDCDPIIEDSTGSFKKGHFDPTTHQLLGNPDDANLFWDAGKVLSDPAQTGYRSADESAANKRTIYTVIDVNGDGKFTAADGLVEFAAANASALAPLMGLPAAGQASSAALPTSGSPATVPWCNTWLNQIGICGLSPLPACPGNATDVRTKCAEQIIHFYRGWDVLDWDSDHCAGPGNYYNTHGWGTCTTSAQCGSGATCDTAAGKCMTSGCPSGEQRDRPQDSRNVNAQEFWKLGDIFHSSPVLVKPPIGKVPCALAVENQCLLTLFSALGTNTTNSTKMAHYGMLDAYDQWLQDTLTRRRFVLVGANDGMLHSFDAGTADTSRPIGFDGHYPYTNGTGGELWAFVPPDLLPQLRYPVDATNTLPQGQQHRYFVDGNTMVRDVWVDGSDGSTPNGIKENTEFRTVAVITERSGGQRFTALDITDAATPKFLWTFPQLCTDDSKLMGQSWADFLPRPPPILPIRIAVAASSGRDPDNRGFEERWIVMVNGGYDPALVRGRAVWMLDVWTGAKLWRWTDADFKAFRGDTTASMFPVPGAIGGMDVGKAENASGMPDWDAYFDTFTWGDLGGNVFVARLWENAQLDGSGLITNMLVARTFEANRKVDNTQAATGRGEFFNMTANFLDGPSRMMTLLGSGNREQLMLDAPACGPDNVLGCCSSGCSVATAVTSTTFGAGSCTQGGTFQCSAGLLTYTPSATAGCGAGFACGTTDQQVNLTFNCGAAGSPTMAARLTCDASGICTTNAPFSSSAQFSTAALGRPLPQYRMYSIWSYGQAPWRRFTTAGEATTFENNRFTDVTYAGCNPVTTSCKLVEVSSAQVVNHGTGVGVTTTCRDGTARCWATREDNGWMYSYGNYCPLASCATATWTDEKTGSAPQVGRGCADWSGFRPTGATGGGTDPCTSSVGSPTSIGYRADAISGLAREFCGYGGTVSGNPAYLQGTLKNAYAPPQSGSFRVVVNDKGQVNYSTLRIETGAPPEKQSLGTRPGMSDPLYWLEVSREAHTCRHVDPTTCQ